jgi:hypothetical protein
MAEFTPEKFLNGPEYSKMTGNLTAEQVRAIADARIKARQKRETQEAA